LKGHTYRVLCVAFSPDGKRLASGSASLASGTTSSQGRPGAMYPAGEAKVWDAQTGQELLTIKGAGPSVAFSPAGTCLASGGGMEVHACDAQTVQEIPTVKDAVPSNAPGTSVAFSPDGKRLAFGSGRDAKVWDAQTGQELLTFKGHTDEVCNVA